MPSVAELTDVYGNFLIGPRHGRGVCELCFNLIDGFERCYACASQPQWLDLIAPISYSIGGEQLHHALASYKRLSGEPARRFTVELAAVLWRHLDVHERCIARAAGIAGDRFALVTSVPSSERSRDHEHPLRRIVGELTGPTRKRYERMLRRSDTPVRARTFSADKYAATGPIEGASVLLIDDTWTTRRQRAERRLRAQASGCRAGRRARARTPCQSLLA